MRVRYSWPGRSRQIRLSKQSSQFQRRLDAGRVHRRGDEDGVEFRGTHDLGAAGEEAHGEGDAWAWLGGEGDGAVDELGEDLEIALRDVCDALLVLAQADGEDVILSDIEHGKRENQKPSYGHSVRLLIGNFFGSIEDWCCNANQYLHRGAIEKTHNSRRIY